MKAEIIAAADYIQTGIDLHKELNGEDIEWNDMCDIIDDYDMYERTHTLDDINDMEDDFKKSVLLKLHSDYGDFHITRD